MIDFSTLQGMSIPEGVVTCVSINGKVVWQKAVTPTVATTYLYGREADSVVSYNGVELPDIDSVWTDKETYPYAYIISDEYGTMLVVSSVLPVVAESGGVTYYGFQGDWCYSEYTDGVWAELSLANGAGQISYTETIWCNTDLLNTDGTTYLAASDPVKSYTDPDVYIDDVGYVGAVLPALPEWDRETYPHVVIANSAAHGYPDRYVVWACSNPWVKLYNETQNYYSLFAEVGTVYKSWVSIAGGAWEDYLEGTVRSAGLTIDFLIWANCDLLDESGNIVLSASEPVPVYE